MGRKTQLPDSSGGRSKPTCPALLHATATATQPVSPRHWTSAAGISTLTSSLHKPEVTLCPPPSAPQGLCLSFPWQQPQLLLIPQVRGLWTPALCWLDSPQSAKSTAPQPALVRSLHPRACRVVLPHTSAPTPSSCSHSTRLMRGPAASPSSTNTTSQLTPQLRLPMSVHPVHLCQRSTFSAHSSDHSILRFPHGRTNKLQHLLLPTKPPTKKPQRALLASDS